MPARIAIVGGGITGLAAAYHLERLTNAEIDLYEAGSALGGKLRTRRVDEFLIEEGPDCFFTRKPGVMELVCELGLESELIQSQQKQFFMLIGGALHRVPGGLVSLTFTNPEDIHAADFLSPDAKQRVLEEVNQPAGTEPDESIKSFFTRRFGADFSRLVAEPLLAGTHGGEPGELSMRALYPGYFDLERKHGSLACGMAAAQPSKPTSPSFLSFRGGMGALVNALTAELKRTRIHLSHRVESTDDLEADHVLLTVPANAAARLVDSETARLVGSIQHRSGAIVTLVYRATDVEHPLDGTGFLVPPSESSSITGATWSSQKWPGRAPEGFHLMRVFLGDSTGSDDDLSRRVVEAISPLLGVRGEPTLEHVTRWIDAFPQYKIGHLDLIARIHQSLSKTPNIHFAGTSYGGVGIPDCLRQARSVAESIARQF